ncbi:DUF2807 domain-containing protein [Flavihumibacter rivuli]|uniref:head GIN domain-containing protein n=1 Tax=Flavihumibacter rivuli TaxID=2838156 RepID=UPI001BDEBC14|nr:head GIN domain-containing protein [Flavihumibacter rivuli]ULQ58201.1 DUF2807 domain-containing protein [Flavihumibacter rivuli]
MKKVIGFLIIISMVFSSCYYGMGKKVKGNGNVTTKTITPGDFARVEQKGAFNITLKSGPSHQVLIEGEDNIISHIETNVMANKLVIKTEEGFRLKPTRDVKITVVSPHYDAVWTYGSGDMVSEGPIVDSTELEIGSKGSGNINLQVRVPAVKAETYGSGDVTISGETREVKMESAGSGNLKASDLKAESVAVEIRGSGDAYVFASKNLDVEVRGSGNVTYKGSPAIKSDFKGSGSLKQGN